VATRVLIRELGEMKARDLRDRTTEDLAELERSLSGEFFQNKFKNFTNRLDDTSVHSQEQEGSRPREAHPVRAGGRHHRRLQGARSDAGQAEDARAEGCRQARRSRRVGRDRRRVDRRRRDDHQEEARQDGREGRPRGEGESEGEPAAKSSAKKAKPKTEKGSK